MSAGPFTLRQLAAALGIDAATVRVLLQLGVLQPPRRRRGHQGDVAFHQEHVERLRFVKRALGVGFHLDDIALLVDPSGMITCGDVFALVSRRLTEMQRTNEDTRRLEAVIGECQPPCRDALFPLCPAKLGRKECMILAKLHGFTSAR